MNLVERVKHILLTPRPEWEVIDGETTTPAGLFTGYVMPLAAIGPIAQVVGYSAFGVRFGGGVYRTPIGSAITSAIIMYVLSAGRRVCARAHHRRPWRRRSAAPGTRSRRSSWRRTRARRAGWRGSSRHARPSRAHILGLYSIYLLYLGLPVPMKAPAEKAGAYTAIVIVAAIVLFAVVTMLTGTFAAMR